MSTNPCPIYRKSTAKTVSPWFTVVGNKRDVGFCVRTMTWRKIGVNSYGWNQWRGEHFLLSTYSVFKLKRNVTYVIVLEVLKYRYRYLSTDLKSYDFKPIGKSIGAKKWKNLQFLCGSFLKKGCTQELKIFPLFLANWFSDRLNSLSNAILRIVCMRHMYKKCHRAFLPLKILWNSSS